MYVVIICEYMKLYLEIIITCQKKETTLLEITIFSKQEKEVY